MLGRNSKITMSLFFITPSWTQDETKLLILFSYCPPSYRTVRQWHLDEFQPSPFLGRNNISVPVKKGKRWYEWLTAEGKSCNNDLFTYFNDSIDNIILDAEVNACGIITIPTIESTFDNYYIHVLHDLPNRYIYEYLISKLISLEATIQNIILQTIWLLLIWDDILKSRETTSWVLTTTL